jgi:uncharacterized protein (DUF1015 family)
MCDVRPFRGLRYDLQRIDSPAEVITPPYDIITPDERSRYYEKSPYNIIRLEYGKEKPADSSKDNKYTRAAATLREWLDEGVLVREGQAALYVIEHSFPYGNADTSRWGLMARVQLEDFETGMIRPHERIKREPAVDRMNLLKACRTNVSPIMGLLRTERGELLALMRRVKEGTPDMTAVDNDGVTYNMWVETDKNMIAGFSALFQQRPIYIADGHHRYETALHYRNEQRAARGSFTGEEPYNFVMMCLMDSQDPGIVMMPTHRLVRGLQASRVAQLEQAISSFFTVDRLLPPLPGGQDSVPSWLRTLETRGREETVLGLYGIHEDKFCILRWRRDADLWSLMTEEEMRLWKDLDVVLLQRVILQLALGIDTPEGEAQHLEYTRDGREAKTRVDTGEFQLAFYLTPAPVSSIVDTSDAGMRMPQKSTYFHPKTPAGLVMNPVWDSD